MLEAKINEKQLTFLLIVFICVYIHLLEQTPSAAWSSWIHHKCLVQRIVFVIVRSKIQNNKTVYQSKEIMAPCSRPVYNWWCKFTLYISSKGEKGHEILVRGCFCWQLLCIVLTRLVIVRYSLWIHFCHIVHCKGSSKCRLLVMK